MVNGFAGQVVKMDLNGTVLGVIGKAGKDVGEFGEAHSSRSAPRENSGLLIR
jgi:hypothetical protein